MTLEPTKRADEEAKRPGSGLWGWLGRQIGHVTKAVKTDVTGAQARTVMRKSRVQEQVIGGEPAVTLRRTTVDEVIVKPAPTAKESAEK